MSDHANEPLIVTTCFVVVTTGPKNVTLPSVMVWKASESFLNPTGAAAAPAPTSSASAN